jgi:hypothetical protein
MHLELDGVVGRVGSSERSELDGLARRLQRRTPQQLLGSLRFRQVLGGERRMPELLVVARRHILDFTTEQLGELAMPAPMSGLIFAYLDEIRAYAEVAPYMPPLDFPTAMHVAACQRALPGPVGAALLCYYIGLHMLDDVHDDELPEGVDRNEASLVALTCVASLPALMLMDGAWWPAPRRVRQRLSTELHFHAHPTMTGQFLDISKSTSCDLPHAYEVIAQRNGAIGRVFGRIAAIAAGCSEPDVDRLGHAVACMSMASQVLDDIENLWNRPVSSDATNHAKTLPLCFVLDRRPELRAQILGLCDDPRPESHRRLRELLARQGALHFSLLGMALFRARARRALLGFGPRAKLGELEEYLLDATAPASSLLGDEAPTLRGVLVEDAGTELPAISSLLEAALQLVDGRPMA